MNRSSSLRWVQSDMQSRFFGFAWVLALLVALPVALLVGCGGGAEVVTTCEDVGELHPICRFQNPEDLAAVDDRGPFIVSQMGDMLDPAATGSIALLDLENESVRVVYPGERTKAIDPTEGWGESSCPGELLGKLNPHGLDLAPRPGGRQRLLVVNHGTRESIEIFEVERRGSDIAVEWRGCVIPPEEAFFNDVVALPDGGFLATHMMSGSPIWGILLASFGFDTGVVYEWNAAKGWSRVEGTEAPFPNGIELSADARDIYLNAYSAGEVRRISRETGELLARAEVASPDNSTWSRDGRLLVASHTGSLSDQMACQGLEHGSCPFAFEIRALDPVTLEGGVIFANEGAPMGAGTVALDVGGELLIGSFSGDRVLRVPFASATAE